MKILRSVNRRGFSVGTVGWFTVLKPNTWLPASLLPGTFRYRGSDSSDTVSVDPADSHEETVPPRTAIPDARDLRLIRPAIIVLAAIAITSALLWWIMSGAPSNAY